MNTMPSAPTLSALTSAVADALHDAGLPPAYAGAFASAITSEVAHYEVEAPAPDGFSLLVGHYAIRKDDLKIFEAVADGIKAAAGVNFFMAQGPVLAANVGMGVALARIVRSLFKRGTSLAPEALHVLTILQCNVRAPHDAGLSVAEILTIAQRVRPTADDAWVKAQLLYLKAVPVRDGGVVALVSEDGVNRWRSHV